MAQRNSKQLIAQTRIASCTILIALLVGLSGVFSLAGADSDTRAGIRETIRSGEALVTAVPQAKMTMRDLCRALGPSNPTYPCYSEPKVAGKNMLYGFHTGAGHGKQLAKEYSVAIGTQRYFLTLDEGRQYSVDRCSLAHDSFYWSREDRDSKVNDYNFFRCIEKVVPGDSAESNAKALVLGGGVISNGLFPKPLGGWRELPSNSADIPETKRSTPREISSSEIKTPKPATPRAGATCKDNYPGSFLDRRNGGECWKCPAGFKRVGFSVAKGLPAVNSKDACVKGEIAGVGGKFASAKYLGKPGCPAGSFEHGITAVCYACPSGYKKNPKLDLTLTIDLRTVPDACIAN
jgi:hypothetical protein